MHHERFGKREGFSDQSSKSLPQREVELLHMVGSSALLSDRPMLRFGNHSHASLEEIGVDLSLSTLFGDRLPELSARDRISVPHGIADDLTDGAAKSNPNPKGVALPGHKAPQFIHFHRTLVFRSQRLLERRKIQGFFFLTTRSPCPGVLRMFCEAPEGSFAPDRPGGFPAFSPPSISPMMDSPGFVFHTLGTGISVSHWGRSRILSILYCRSGGT